MKVNRGRKRGHSGVHLPVAATRSTRATIVKVRATRSPPLRKANKAATKTSEPTQMLCRKSRCCSSQRKGQKEKLGSGKPSGCGQMNPRISAG